jgi:hypothetical protein
VPAGLLPNTTAELRLNGSFFTPQSVVNILGQTINNIEFDGNTGALILSLTTGLVEGDFDIEISNGTNVVFENKLSVVLGTVTPFTNSSFSNVSNTFDLINGNLRKNDITVNSSARSVMEFPFDKNWDFSVNQKISPLFGELLHTTQSHGNNNAFYRFKRVSDNSNWMFFYDILEGASGKFYYDGVTGKRSSIITQNPETEYWNANDPIKVRYNKDNNTIQIIYKGTIKKTLVLPSPLLENVYLEVASEIMDVKDIKYIELEN